jgi:hypothetical protein
MERDLDFAPPGLNFVLSGLRLVACGLVFIPPDFQNARPLWERRPRLGAAPANAAVQIAARRRKVA